MKICVTEEINLLNEVIAENLNKKIAIISNDSLTFEGIDISILNFNDIEDSFTTNFCDVMVIFKPGKLIYDYSIKLNEMKETVFKRLINFLYSELTIEQLKGTIFEFNEDNSNKIEISESNLTSILDSYNDLLNHIEFLEQSIKKNKELIQQILYK